MDLDAHIWLRCSEDCEVDAVCRTCDRCGEPVAWYTGGKLPDGQPLYPNPYDEGRVPTGTTIEEFFGLARQHVSEVHGG